MAKYMLILESIHDPTDEAGIRRLRWILKQLLRNHRCRCLRIEQVKEPTDDDRLIEQALLADGGDLLPGNLDRRFGRKAGEVASIGTPVHSAVASTMGTSTPPPPPPVKRYFP